MQRLTRLIALPHGQPCLLASLPKLLDVPLSTHCNGESIQRYPDADGRRVGESKIEKPVEQGRRLGLRAGHQVAVEIEGDLDRRMAHED